MRVKVRPLSRRRLYTTSYKDAFVSIGTCHTETINIWSHLLGAAWFSYSAARFVLTCPKYTHNTIVVFTYLGATSLCFACSAIYHICADHVHASLWLLLDHGGIICAIWASSVSFTLLSFQGRKREGQMYAALISVTAIVCIARILAIPLHDLHSRSARISTHVALGGFAALPGGRIWYLLRSGQPSPLLIHFWAMFVLNSTGGGIYATHFLDEAIEVCFGVPDASHNAMHIMAVAGAWMYTKGLSSRSDW
ncbi:hypothetical protein CC86DRAFT_309718 [Ophiobolus disseminans]|uniref:Hly-III related protein n=1 Tax=Ophiobolus disseminans TaxID=1469910 RepID=A0A6A6ZAP8_9PLEO|nr:hypothetical protein CC86DRAFT_309718 [Ophiobolus disseminans]